MSLATRTPGSKQRPSSSKSWPRQNIVFCYARNDRLEFNIPYELYGNPQVYEPDFIVRLRNSVNVVLEIKGKSHEDTDAKHQAAKRWVSAVNHWGTLGEWDFLVCREPQRLAEEFANLIEARKQRIMRLQRSCGRKRKVKCCVCAHLAGRRPILRAR